KKERISPWLLITVLVAIIIPFLGSTRMNSQFMVTLFYGIAIAAGFSCIAIDNESYGFALIGKETESDDVEESETDEDVIIDAHNEPEVIRPMVNEIDEVTIEEGEPEEIYEEEQISDENIVVDSEAEEISVQENEPEDTTKENVLVKEQPKPENKVRFVPEGMVVPMGEEDEEDFVTPTHMKMPVYKESEPIAINRKDKNKEDLSSATAKKDDFAIDIEDGDDFAI
ncbi:MAG: hypothetical protein K6A23_13070, partial [Butyrivibrio sp.]|nr:hypothetical protein [Butyrivibrio sp.]